jgi:hypothetical protein
MSPRAMLCKHAHHDHGLRLGIHDQAQGIQSIHDGHLNIHRDNIRIKRLILKNGRLAIIG